MNAAAEVANRAEQLSKDTGISFQAALGQIIGGLIFEVDALLYEHQAERVGDTYEGEFAKGLYETFDQWFI